MSCRGSFVRDSDGIWLNGGLLRWQTLRTSKAQRELPIRAHAWVLRRLGDSLCARTSLILSRFGPGQTHDDVRQAFSTAIASVQNTFPALQASIIFEQIETMPSFQVDKSSYIVKRLNAAYTAVRPHDKQPTGALPPQCYYGSDAGHLYTKLGLEGVVCGPGGKYNTMPDERVEVSGRVFLSADREIVDYMDCVRMFIRLIMDVCG